LTNTTQKVYKGLVFNLSMAQPSFLGVLRGGGEGGKRNQKAWRPNGDAGLLFFFRNLD